MNFTGWNTSWSATSSFATFRASVTTDNLAEITRVARANPNIESLSVMSDNEQLVGIIHAEDLHRVLDTDGKTQLGPVW